MVVVVFCLHRLSAVVLDPLVPAETVPQVLLDSPVGHDDTDVPCPSEVEQQRSSERRGHWS